MTTWIETGTKLPPEGIEVITKIDDAEYGPRNVATLKRTGNLWWTKDMTMYVYYVPTHWMMKA